MFACGYSKRMSDFHLQRNECDEMRTLVFWSFIYDVVRKIDGKLLYKDVTIIWLTNMTNSLWLTLRMFKRNRQIYNRYTYYICDKTENKIKEYVFKILIIKLKIDTAYSKLVYFGLYIVLVGYSFILCWPKISDF